jgi:hypothetical protein
VNLRTSNIGVNKNVGAEPQQTLSVNEQKNNNTLAMMNRIIGCDSGLFFRKWPLFARRCCRHDHNMGFSGAQKSKK